MDTTTAAVAVLVVIEPQLDLVSQRSQITPLPLAQVVQVVPVKVLLQVVTRQYFQRSVPQVAAVLVVVLVAIRRVVVQAAVQRIHTPLEVETHQAHHPHKETMAVLLLVRALLLQAAVAVQVQ